MIRYLLVDDEPKTSEFVKEKIDSIANDYDLKHVASYNSSKQAYEEVNPSDFDLLIVDFEMPVYNGLELAAKIASDKKIIFLTSTTQNEKKVINTLDISGYMSKPFDVDELQTILKNKIIGKINRSFQKGDLITLSSGKNKDIGLFPHKIYYISTARNTTNDGHKPQKNHLTIYGENDLLEFDNIRLNITDLAEKLNYYGFERINSSTIINTAYIKERDNKNLQLQDTKETFVISDTHKKSFLEFFKSKLGI
jgi:YesN/AraC family two-component response regulator